MWLYFLSIIFFVLGYPFLENVMASIMTGIQFMNALHQGDNPTRDSSFDSDQSDESVLQHPKNREYLKKQGYYKQHKKTTPKCENAASHTQVRINRSQKLDATERRKMFYHTRSSDYSQEKSPSRNSRDRSLLRSFTSTEYSDSFESNEEREGSLDKRAYMGRQWNPNQNNDWDIGRPAVSLGDIAEGLISKKESCEQEMSSNDEMQRTQVKETELSFKSKTFSRFILKFQEMRKSNVKDISRKLYIL